MPFNPGFSIVENGQRNATLDTAIYEAIGREYLQRGTHYQKRVTLINLHSMEHGSASIQNKIRNVHLNDVSKALNEQYCSMLSFFLEGKPLIIQYYDMRKRNTKVYTFI